MQHVTLREAQDHLSDLIQAAVSGEEVVIQGEASEAVRLVPVHERTGHPRFGSGKGGLVMSDDFDEPLPDFAEYMR